MIYKTERPSVVGSFCAALERCGVSRVANELGLSYHTVYAWKARDWIEPAYWDQLATLGVRGVNKKVLIDLATARSAEREAARKQRRAARPSKPAKGSKAAPYQAFTVTAG